MNTPATDPELKVCRHCSVASRTDSETCPGCGRPYERRLWRWWFAVPIVALAFAAGYFGLSKVIFDDGDSGLTIEEARALATGGSPGDLKAVIDGENPVNVRRQNEGGFELNCRYYSVVDVDDTVWEACYLDGRLEVSRPITVEPR